ncbi:MAG: rRNA pseudouridine synthase [Patescibacteria group bacterium]|nr:rRNA pseudouridine synthase [Patescibacteria group bacterium]
MPEIIYPIRINKYLAKKNICSRRKADDFISRKLVKINGRTAVLGDKVQKEDRVELNSKVEKITQKFIYLAYNKPIGVASHLPQENEIGIRETSSLPKDIFPVGRLDKESRGLMILTNDGRITEKLLDPKFYHEKEYEVLVNKPINNYFINKMQNGIRLEGFTTRPCQLKKLDTNKFSIVLTEGKKHQIRRMCTALGYEVKDLQRVRIGQIRLKDLAVGATRPLTGKEIEKFFSY